MRTVHSSPVIRLAALSTHPIQYQAPLFRALSARPDVDLTVLFCNDHGVQPSFDTNFNRLIQYDVPLLEGYRYRFLSNVAFRPGVRATGLVNPDAFGAVLRAEFDALVVHGYNFVTHLSVLLGPRRRTRILLRGDSHLLPRRPLHVRAAKRLLLRALFARVDQFLASGVCNREYYRSYGVRDDRISLAPFTVDNEYFSTRSEEARRDPASARRKLGLPEAAPLFLVVGKLIPLKRPLDALRAFAIAQKSGPCALAYVGDGEMRTELEREIAHLGLADRVCLLGFRNQSELPAIYGCSDVLLLPSSTEPWGLVVNEALACGMAALVSDHVGAAPDLVPDPECVFSVGDVRRLAATMEAIIRQPERLRSLKREANERIRAWGLEQTADGIVAGVRTALARRSRVL